jgi:iron complex outermembrane recepter protein
MMWVKKFSVLGWILVFCFSASAQQLATISGNVKDRSGKSIDNATVRVLNANGATSTDAAGNFSLAVNAAGSYTLEVSHIGFSNFTGVVKTEAGNQLNIILYDIAAQLEDIVVTANKREQVLQKTPGSISAFTARDAVQYRLWNTKELTGIVPNFFANNSGDDRNVSSIRGITTTSYDPAVAVYVDGVNQFSLDTYIPQLADIERIEVLRGPQGSLYGRNAMGGVVNIITKQPRNTTNGFAEINVGDYGLQRYSAGIRTPVVKDKLYFGAAAVFQKRNGYYQNDFNNSSFDKQQAFTGNYFLKYLLNQQWSVTANLKHQNNRNSGAFPLVYGVEDAISNPYKVNQNAVGTMADNTLNASLAVVYTGKNFQFSAQSAWQSNRRIYETPIDGDFSPIDGVTVVNDYGGEWNKVKVFTQEFRFSSPAQNDGKLSWVAGLYFYSQRNPTKQGTHFGEDAELIGVPGKNFTTINTSLGKNKGMALFAQANYALNKQLSVIGGLRIDRESKYLSVNGQYQPDGEDAITTQPDTSSTARFSAVSPKLGLAYELNKTSNLFATYSRGFRTGGLTQLSSDPSQPPLYPYKPEYSNNIEIGWKNLAHDNRLRLNITAFYTVVTDAQVPTLVLPDAFTVTRNTGKLKSKGVELELAAKPLKGFDIIYNFGYTQAKYSSLKVAQNGNAVDLSGKKQIFTPDRTSMLALQYGYAIGRKYPITVSARAEWFYIGETYFDLANNLRQSPYQLLNLRVGASSKWVDVFFWARNLTGKKYVAYAYDFGAVHLADPATKGITASFRF